MICWFCYHGWPKVIRDIYHEATKTVPEDVMTSAAHIVWEDENFEREHVEWNLAHLYEDDATERYSIEELAVVRRSLEALLALPDSTLYPRPDYDDSDGMHPENYPPPAGLEMDRT